MGTIHTLTRTTRTRSSLADALAAENAAEESGWLAPLDRLTCQEHNRWIHECVHSQAHVSVITGHRWCRSCRRELDVAVDHLTGSVTVHCERCDRGPSTYADRQLIAACEASLAASKANRLVAAA